jgi:hypothetical protein
MSKYQNGKIYKIVSPNTSNIYVGSTIQPLQIRYSHHKTHLNCSSKTMFDYEDTTIELIENYPCNTEKELVIREQEIRDSMDNTINKNRSGYYIDTPEEKSKYNIEMKKRHRKKIIAYRTAKTMCSCGTMVTKGNQPSHLKSNKHFKLLSKSV